MTPEQAAKLIADVDSIRFTIGALMMLLCLRIGWAVGSYLARLKR